MQPTRLTAFVGVSEVGICQLAARAVSYFPAGSLAFVWLKKHYQPNIGPTHVCYSTVKPSYGAGCKVFGLVGYFYSLAA